MVIKKWVLFSVFISSLVHAMDRYGHLRINQPNPAIQTTADGTILDPMQFKNLTNPQKEHYLCMLGRILEKLDYEQRKRLIIKNIEQGVPADDIYIDWFKGSTEILIQAIQARDEDFVRFLLQNGLDSNHGSLRLYVTRFPLTSIAQLLMQHGTPVTDLDERHNTALMRLIADPNTIHLLYRNSEFVYERARELVKRCVSFAQLNHDIETWSTLLDKLIANNNFDASMNQKLLTIKRVIEQAIAQREAESCKQEAGSVSQAQQQHPKLTLSDAQKKALEHLDIFFIGKRSLAQLASTIGATQKDVERAQYIHGLNVNFSHQKTSSAEKSKNLVTQAIIEKNVHPDEIEGALEHAVKMEDEPYVQFLLEHGATIYPSLLLLVHKPTLATILLNAGGLTIKQKIFSAKYVDFYGKDNYRINAPFLHYLVFDSKCEADLLYLYVSQGLDVNVQDLGDRNILLNVIENVDRLTLDNVLYDKICLLINLGIDYTVKTYGRDWNKKLTCLIQEKENEIKNEKTSWKVSKLTDEKEKLLELYNVIKNAIEKQETIMAHQGTRQLTELVPSMPPVVIALAMAYVSSIKADSVK